MTLQGCQLATPNHQQKIHKTLDHLIVWKTNLKVNCRNHFKNKKLKFQMCPFYLLFIIQLLIRNTILHSQNQLRDNVNVGLVICRSA